MQFPCLICGNSIELDDKYGGLKGPCPHCGRTVTAPLRYHIKPSDKPADWGDLPLVQPVSAQSARDHKEAKGDRGAADGPSSEIDAVALFFAVLLAVACWLPWIQLETIFVNRGIDNHDGALVLVLSIAAAAIAITNILAKQNRRGLLYALIGLVALVIAAIDLQTVFERSADAAEALNDLSSLFGFEFSVAPLRFVGSGLYIALASAVGLICVGFISWGRSIRRR